MSRSKILADIAGQDVTAAEFDVLDGFSTSGTTLKWDQQFLGADFGATTAAASTTFWTPTFTPTKNNSVVYAMLHLMLETTITTGTGDNRKKFNFAITGDNLVSEISHVGQWGWDWYGAFHSATVNHDGNYISLPKVTYDGNGTAVTSYALQLMNESGNAGTGWKVFGDGLGETSIIFIEVAP